MALDCFGSLTSCPANIEIVEPDATDMYSMPEDQKNMDDQNKTPRGPTGPVNATCTFHPPDFPKALPPLLPQNRVLYSEFHPRSMDK